MIVHHFETRGGWKFTDFLNTDLAIPHRAHKRFKIKNKNKNKKPKKRGRIKKKTKIHLLRFEPPNPRARQEHDQRTVGQRQSVSVCGCCFNFVEYIAVKKECINQQRKKKKEGKKTGFVAGIEPSTIGSMPLLLTTRPFRMITYSQTVLLDIDFPLISKLLVQIAYIFSAKYLSHRNASPKAFF